MRVLPLPGLLLCLLLLPACASPYDASASSTVALGPGGRAEGRILSTPVNRIRLVNRGPGRVDFVLKDAHGHAAVSGSLGVATSRWTDDPAEGRDDDAAFTGALFLVLEAYRDEGGAVVEWSLDGVGGAGIDWDLSRAGP